MGKREDDDVKAREDAKAFKLGQQVLHESDLEFTVPYKNELFTMRFPTPLLKAQIESDIARRLDGLPRSSYPDDHLITIEATAYANNLIVPDKSPSWFTSAWTCYDEELIAALYSGYLSFRGTFRKKLQSGGFTPSS